MLTATVTFHQQRIRPRWRFTVTAGNGDVLANSARGWMTGPAARAAARDALDKDNDLHLEMKRSRNPLVRRSQRWRWYGVDMLGRSILKSSEGYANSAEAEEVGRALIDGDYTVTFA